MNKQSGINTKLNDKCSSIAYSWAKKTFANRKNKNGMSIIDSEEPFANLLDFNGTKIGITSDGIGTKIEIVERVGIYNRLGYDLVAMVADDLVCNGIEPTNLSNILDVDYLDYDIVDKLMEGLYEACSLAGILITGGEIAELGNRINGYGDKMHFNWCATAIGILHYNLKKPIDGKNIKIGDVVISLKEYGFRSNGFSLIRKIMLEKFGDEWHNVVVNNPHSTVRNWIEAILSPSLIYSPIICKLLNEKFVLKGIAHITGGGIPSKFGRVLKASKYGAELDNLFEPPEIMKELMNIGGISKETAYNIWNMGNGMLIVVNKDSANEIVNFINQNGYTAKVCGKIISEPIIKIGENLNFIL